MVRVVTNETRKGRYDYENIAVLKVYSGGVSCCYLGFNGVFVAKCLTQCCYDSITRIEQMESLNSIRSAVFAMSCYTAHKSNMPNTHNDLE